MELEKLKNKKILILGYGVEGKATHEFLKKHLPNAKIGIADRELNGENYLDKQKDYDIAVKSPGIHKSKVKIPYTTATNIFFANNKGITIGITGTKGKSTTSSLIYSILKRAGKKVKLVGNITHKLYKIGEPMLQAMDGDSEKNTIFVTELSSYQLDDLKFAPQISVFTSFFPEHMDFHGSVEDYWKAKKRIVAYANSDDMFVYNPDFPIIAKLARETNVSSLPYVETLSFPDKIIPLLGKHNNDNVRAAVTVAKLLGIDDKTIKEAVKNYKPLPYRLQFVGTFKGISFYDDSISTTPQSTIYAIKALSPIGTILLGGQDRGYDFKDLARVIVEKKIRNFVLFPDSGYSIFKEIQKFDKKTYNIIQTSSMAEAVRFAYANTPKGKICLLSTASPSYSVWKNFEEKGRLFQQAVKNYSKKTIDNL